MRLPKRSEKPQQNEPPISKPSPLDSAGVGSVLGMFFLNPLLQRGAKSPLKDEDLEKVPIQHSSSWIDQRFAPILRVHKGMMRSFWKAFGNRVVLSFLISVPYVLLSQLSPLIIKAFLHYLQTPSEELWWGVILAFGLFVCQALGTVCLNLGFYQLLRFAFQVRTSSMLQVYSKALRLSSASKSCASTGEIVTLMSVDSERLWIGCILANWLWMGPAFLIIVSALLLWEIGVSALAGIAVLLISNWGSTKLANTVARVRRGMLKATAERVKMQSEILQGIRIVKLYAWEDSMLAKVAAFRKEELKHLRKFLLLNSLSFLFQFVSPVFAAAAVFILYTGLGNDLSVQQVYTVLAFLNLLRVPLALWPAAQKCAADGLTSLGRLNKFLALDEVEPHILPASDVQPSEDLAIDIRSSDFWWQPPDYRAGDLIAESVNIGITHLMWVGLTRLMGCSQRKAVADKAAPQQGDKNAPTEPTLKDVSLQVPRGSLTMVVGPVGSGKTSLLNAILGELKHTKGSMSVSGRVAYVGQESWVRNATVKENVLFTLPLDADLYSRVLSVAQLDADLKVLPDGDNTEVGERGITLSGGQKARLCFARALYRAGSVNGSSEPACEMFLLDDPLSAVDMHVARRLFEDAIAGMLKDKTVLLVLNSHYHLLRHAHHIVVMAPQGKIAMQGTYEQLESNPAFADYIATAHGDDHGPEPSVQLHSEALDNAADIRSLHSLEVFSPVLSVHRGVLSPAHRPASIGGFPLIIPDEVLDIRAEARDDGTTLRVTGAHHHTDQAAERRARIPSELEIEFERVVSGVRSPSGSPVVLPREIAANGRPKTSVLPPAIAEQLRARRPSDTGAVPQRATGDTDVSTPQVPGSPSPLPAAEKDKTADKQQTASAGPAGQLIKQEERETGKVRGSTYGTYFAAAVGAGKCVGYMIFLGLGLVFATAQVGRVMTDWWIGYWSANAQSSDRPATFWLAIYVGLCGGSALVACAKEVWWATTCTSASSTFHDSIFRRVLRAPVNLFFDVTPLGRVINRFSKDLDQVDSLLPDTFEQAIQNILAVLSFLILCVVATPWFVLAILPLLLVFILVQNYFRKSTRELKRLDGISRSPIFSSFEETLNGLVTIRAFNMPTKFYSLLKERVDANNRFYIIFNLVGRWLALRLDFMCACTVLIIALLLAGLRDTINPALAGLALTYVMQMASLLQWTVRVTIDTENNMTAVERLDQYNHIPSEAPVLRGTLPAPPEYDEALQLKLHNQIVARRRSRQQDSAPGAVSLQVDRMWPWAGEVEFRDVWLRYRPELEPALRGLSFKVRAGEKVGICGRTGAGKSSILQALFRIVEVSESDGGGSVLIDGVDTRSVGLGVLRGRLAVIPQDPVLFSGTLRENLDPFAQFEDAALWDALEKAHLAADVRLMPGQLDSPVAERGENFSLGQRQLVCVARALLRGSRVIMLDEATASVDSVTDLKIQRSIRSGFASATVLTIAHRLETIVHCDRVLVMDQGRVAEFSAPLALLEDPRSVFRSLVASMGQHVLDKMIAMARDGPEAGLEENGSVVRSGSNVPVPAS